MVDLEDAAIRLIRGLRRTGTQLRVLGHDKPDKPTAAVEATNISSVHRVRPPAPSFPSIHVVLGSLDKQGSARIIFVVNPLFSGAKFSTSS